MNRSNYWEFISDKLHVLAHKIITHSKLNVLNQNVHAENFYIHFFNLLYDYSLKNMNNDVQNAAAIDLIDHKHKIVIQVSSTNTKRKIEEALKKDIIKQYSSYTFKFISIAKDAKNLRKATIENPHNICFDPKKDIYDVKSILDDILSFDIDKQEVLSEFVKKELTVEISLDKVESNLTTIINILAEDKLDDVNLEEVVAPFNIEEKIAFNQLGDSKETIDDCVSYYTKLDNIYQAYDKEGKNKSNSVLASLRRMYREAKRKEEDPNIIFDKITEAVIKRVKDSANYSKILPTEELESYAEIVVVDAFVRCKIFKNPNQYNRATS